MTIETNTDDALCPVCCKPASRTLPVGWLWRCEPCEWEWGHPQGMDRVTATEMLYELKRKERDK